MIHRLRKFKYNNTCELCDKIIERYNIGRTVANKWFVLHEEVIDVFHDKFYNPTIEKLSFHIYHVRILGSMECMKTRNDFFHKNAQK